MERTARDRWWLVYLAAGVGAVVAYRLFDDARVQTGIVLGVTVATVAAIGIGVRRHRPAAPRFWGLLAAAVAVWGGLGWGIWEAYILETGSPPASGSVADVFFLLGAVLVVCALAQLARSGGATRRSLDWAIATVGILGFAWVVVIGKYVGDAHLPAIERLTQTVYAVTDVAMLVTAIFVTIAARRRPAAEWIFVAGAGALLVADFSWNWLTFVGQYAPGSYVDLGYLPFLVLPGVAALHPSMARAATLVASAPATERRRYVLLLCTALAIIPATLVKSVLSHEGIELIVVDALVVAVVALVVARIAVLLGQAHRLRAQMEEQNVRLQELDALKDEFVATVSHELRTPLTSIRGYAELLGDDDTGELNEDQREFVEIIARNSNRLLRVVGDLLFVARLESGTFAVEGAPVDFAAIVRESAAAIAPVAEDKGVAVDVEAPERLALSGDRTRLAQLVDNLLSNAVKFTPDGGSVAVRVGAAEGVATLEVEDTGIGISREDQDRLFERFFRSDEASRRSIQGTGLGLSIARAIAEGHGGAIRVRSEPGRGTTFSVDLPLGAPQEHPVAVA